MDPHSALSVAASVVRLFDFTEKVVNLLNQQSQTKSTSDERFASVGSDVKSFQSSLSRLRLCLEGASGQEPRARTRIAAGAPSLILTDITESLSTSETALEELSNILISRSSMGRGSLPWPVGGREDIQRRIQVENYRLRICLQKLELQSVTRPDDHSRVDPFDHKHIIPATPPRILGVCKAMRTEKRRGGGAAIPDPDILETPVDHSRYLRVFATLLVAASGAGIMGTWAPNGTCSTSGFGSLQPGVKVFLSVHPKLDSVTNSPITLVAAMIMTSLSLTTHHYDLAQRKKQKDLLVIGIVGGGTAAALLMGLDGMTVLLRVEPWLGILAFLVCEVSARGELRPKGLQAGDSEFGDGRLGEA